MLPRDKLKQCFTCKHNLQCWGLDEDVPTGIDERTNSLSVSALCFFIVRNLRHGASLGAQINSLCGCFIATLKKGNMDNIGRDASQVENVVCALCNTPNDGWGCPGEDETVEEEWIYEVRK